MQNQAVLVKENPNTGEIVTMKTGTDKDGNAIELGTIRVAQVVMSVKNGFINTSTRSAFMTLRPEQLSVLKPLLLKDKPFPIEGKLVITETLEPYVSKSGKVQDAKINPTTKAQVLYQGKPVYMNTTFESDMNAKDFFLRDTPTLALAGADDATE